MWYIVYETTNLINSKKYRGIHQTTKLDDGYLGSGLALKRAVKKHGKENFKREILEYCSSFDELLEREKLYVNEEWVKDKSNYNMKTGGQSAGILSKESRDKIAETLRQKYANGELKFHGILYVATEAQNKQISETLKERYRNQEHHLKGRKFPGRGKGNIPWNKGKETGPMSEKQKDDISKTLKERYKKQGHHLKGRPSLLKGIKRKDEAWNKGKKMKQVACPHCGKMVDVGNSKRWHFDNCKLKKK
jgi:hypothetical protein